MVARNPVIERHTCRYRPLRKRIAAASPCGIKPIPFKIIEENLGSRIVDRIIMQDYGGGAACQSHASKIRLAKHLVYPILAFLREGMIL